MPQTSNQRARQRCQRLVFDYERVTGVESSAQITRSESALTRFASSLAPCPLRSPPSPPCYCLGAIPTPYPRITSHSRSLAPSLPLFQRNQQKMQIWDTFQALATYLRGMLCTQALLTGGRTTHVLLLECTHIRYTSISVCNYIRVFVNE